MVDEVKKLDYIYEWFCEEQPDGTICGRWNEDWIPDQATCFARINSYDWKAAKILEIKLHAKDLIEAIVPQAIQAKKLAEAARLQQRIIDGETLTAEQQAKLDGLKNLEDTVLQPIRDRSNQLEAQINAMPDADWQAIADFDVAGNW